MMGSKRRHNSSMHLFYNEGIIWRHVFNVLFFMFHSLKEQLFNFYENSLIQNCLTVVFIIEN